MMGVHGFCHSLQLPSAKIPPAHAQMLNFAIDIPHGSDRITALSHVAGQHTLKNVGVDLRSRIRRVHVITAKLRILLVHQDLSVHSIAFGVHVSCGRGIGAWESRDLAAQLTYPA